MIVVHGSTQVVCGMFKDNGEQFMSRAIADAKMDVATAATVKLGGWFDEEKSDDSRWICCGNAENTVIVESYYTLGQTSTIKMGECIGGDCLNA